MRQRAGPGVPLPSDSARGGRPTVVLFDELCHDPRPLAVLIHRFLLQPAVGFQFRHLTTLHEDRLRALDEPPFFQHCLGGG
jgi:hypothetical protein